MNSRLSPSGARIRGDDYQHLFAWIQVLRALQPQSGVAEFGIEDPDAGNADDVTLYYKDGIREYFQAKSSVDARDEIGLDWLIKPNRAGRPSLMQRFYRLWRDDTPTQQRPSLTLVTNIPAASRDPIMSLRDGRDGTVARRLKIAKPNSKPKVALKTLVDHLNASEEETLIFLSDLRFIVGRLQDEWKAQATPLMYAAGLRYDEEAIVLGISVVRGWVTEGTRKLTIDELRKSVEHLTRPGEVPAASLLVQAIDLDPMPENALIALDWAHLFPGDEPRTRRLPTDDGLWNNLFRPDLQKAAQELRAQGHSSVIVQGYMRLPTWFASGAELGRTAGYQVVSFQNEEPWSSEGEYSEFPVEVVDEEIGVGDELAIGLAVAFDLSGDVVNYLRSTDGNVGLYVCIRPQYGASNKAISSAAQARGWAYETRDEIRRIVQKHRPPKIHLFLATPHGAALLLGHLWDRMPCTQLYEDLGPNSGYAPSFLIPN